MSRRSARISALATLASVALAVSASAQGAGDASGDGGAATLEPQDSEVPAEELSGPDDTRSGYENRGERFGGPTATAIQLEFDDLRKDPIFRNPWVDELWAPWFDLKRSLDADHGFRVAADYAALYQKISDSLGEDEAASGAVRVYFRWELLDRGGERPGSLVAKVEDRHRYTTIAPSDLGFEAGYRGITGTQFNNAGGIIGDLYWTQTLVPGRAGAIAGRFDPNDFQDMLGYANPWTGFQNLSVLVNTAVALPDWSWGAGGGVMLTDNWYALGTFNDANGTTGDLGWFEGGAEFYKQITIGWTPSRGERFTNDVHTMIWHADEREDAGVEESWGATLGGIWYWDPVWLAFGRLGWSEGNAPLMNETATAGLARLVNRSQDTMGLGVNWGDPSDGARSQWAVEGFLNVQLSERVEITPSIQWIGNPSDNLDEDHLWLFGLRARVVL